MLLRLQPVKIPLENSLAIYVKFLKLSTSFYIANILTNICVLSINFLEFTLGSNQIYICIHHSNGYNYKDVKMEKNAQ